MQFYENRLDSETETLSVLITAPDPRTKNEDLGVLDIDDISILESVLENERVLQMLSAILTAFDYRTKI